MKKLIFSILVALVATLSVVAQTPAGVPAGAVYAGSFTGADGNTYEIWNHGSQPYHVCKSCSTPAPIVVTPPAPQGCSDCISSEVMLQMLAMMRQQGGNGGQQLTQSDLLLIQQREEELRLQRKQLRWGVAMGMLSTLSNAGNSIWNNILVQKGYYRSNVTTNVWGTGGNGPWMGGTTGGNGGPIIPNNDPRWNGGVGYTNTGNGGGGPGMWGTVP